MPKLPKKKTHTRIHRERVRCRVCGKITAGRMPKGGDGTLYYPRRHKPLYDYRGLHYTGGDLCVGMLDEAELVREN